MRIELLERARRRERQAVRDRLADDVGGQGGAQAGGDQPLLGGVGRGRARRRRRPCGRGLEDGRATAGRRERGDGVELEVVGGLLDRGAVRLRAVEAGGGRAARSRAAAGGPGRGGEQDLLGALADRALGARERVGERGGLVDQRLDRRRGEALGGRAVVAGLQRLLVGQRRAGVDLDVGALEEAGDAAREALAAAQHDGVRAELGADLRQHLLEAAAAEGLDVVAISVVVSMSSLLHRH